MKGYFKMQEIGEKIRFFRKEKKLTQEELAERVGVSAQAISKWEIGLSMPDISLLLPLCRELDISVDYLLGGNRRNELEQKFQQALRKGEEYTLLVSNEALRDFPDDRKWLYRRAMDEYFLAISKNGREREAYLLLAEGHFKKLCEKFPEEDSYKSTLAEIYFMQGKKDDAFVLAYKCKEKDKLLKKILEGEDLEKHKCAILKKKFNSFLYELFDYDTLGALDLAEKFLDLFNCEYLIWQVYARRAQIYKNQKDFENFELSKNKAEFLAKKTDEKYQGIFQVSATEQLYTWGIFD